MSRTFERTPGEFWQEYSVCGKRAEAGPVIDGDPILCATCSGDRGYDRLPIPNDYERRAWREGRKSRWPPVTIKRGDDTWLFLEQDEPDRSDPNRDDGAS